jgi:hypothetical protein
MKYAVGISWLVLALIFQRGPGMRRFFAYAGPMVALAHAGALGIGLLYAQLFDKRSVEGGVSLVGFLIGIVIGLIAGALLGGTVLRNTALYWIAQIVAAGFLVFLPLFRS